MILLSAGHYPEAPGACFFNWCEHAEALKWVYVIAHFLHEQDHVDLVPSVPLSKKVRWINDYAVEPAILAVEIHFNSAPKHVGDGFETLYAPNSVTGERVAGIVNTAMVGIMGRDRGTKPGWYRQDIPGVEDYPGDVDGDEKPDYFLSATRPWAIIIEPEFIHNKVSIETNRDAACKALAGGILKAVEVLREKIV